MPGASARPLHGCTARCDYLGIAQAGVTLFTCEGSGVVPCEVFSVMPCEICGHVFAQKHRLKPGEWGGTYDDLDNVSELCPNHHAAIQFLGVYNDSNGNEHTFTASATSAPNALADTFVNAAQTAVADLLPGTHGLSMTNGSAGLGGSIAEHPVGSTFSALSVELQSVIPAVQV